MDAIKAPDRSSKPGMEPVISWWYGPRGRTLAVVAVKKPRERRWFYACDSISPSLLSQQLPEGNQLFLGYFIPHLIHLQIASPRIREVA